MNPIKKHVAWALIAATNSLPAANVQADVNMNKIKHLVVIYQENHSFDNLYGDWEGVNGRSATSFAPQVNQSGAAYACIQQNQPGLTSPTPLPVTCTDTINNISSAFGNSDFPIEKYIPSNTYNCPGGNTVGGVTGGGCTEDLVHRYYQHQYQLNGGAMNRYVTGSDAIGLSIGYYATKSLPIYQYLHTEGHPHYVVADNFFHAAFGGSFLNHQWLVAANTPLWPSAVNDGGTQDLHSVVDINGMPTSYPLYKTPATYKLNDGQLTASCAPAASRGPTPPGTTCGDFAINTIQPTYQPFSPGTASYKLLPPQTQPTIADRLIGRHITWAWYSGGWDNANGNVKSIGWTNGQGPRCANPSTIQGATYPNCPDNLFQFHHQPLNYYATFDPTTKAGTRNRASYLKDELEFLKAAQTSKARCKLRQVSFVKPIGEGNEHPGYASENLGSDHLVSLISAVMNGACAKDTMIMVAYDEFGGQFDHVIPPGTGKAQGPHDQWGPGNRVPSLVISSQLPNQFGVDRTLYDTTSILATIEKRFNLEPLSTRDASVENMFKAFQTPAYVGP